MIVIRWCDGAQVPDHMFWLVRVIPMKTLLLVKPQSMVFEWLENLVYVSSKVGSLSILELCGNKNKLKGHGNCRAIGPTMLG